MNLRYFFLALPVVCAFLPSGVSSGAVYTLTPVWNSPGIPQIQAGVPFQVDFTLTSGASDTCDSVIFDVAFSSPDTVVNSYTWGGGFSTSIYDNSNPFNLHFENFLLSEPAFSSGTLLSLNLTLPTDVSPLPETLVVSAMPGTFALGTQTFVPQAGPALTLKVIPEPCTGVLLAVGCALFLAVGIRRRP